MKTSLLCTFCTDQTLAETIAKIKKSYRIAFDAIYVLENLDNPGSLCCTYNIDADAPVIDPIPPSTISLHRKKQTNTLYTINALNKLVEEQNDGKLDVNFPVNWSELRNMILVTQYGSLKKIRTKLRTIIRLNETSNG
jgi:hypothetical protein